MTRSSPWLAVVGLLLVCLGGCSSTPTLMPTPNLYAWSADDPFADVPPELQNNHVDVLYLTDRAPENDAAGNLTYGYKRSRAVAVGKARVQFGKDMSWEQLVKASRSAKRSEPIEVTLTQTTELVRFPPTPKALIELPEQAGMAVTRPTTNPTTLRAEIDKDTQIALAALSEQLAKTPVKEVYVFIHGYNNSFQDSVATIAELWHFLGRRGVPIAYSWPAGATGLLRGYNYDFMSSQFTVFHLKQMLRIIAACPDVRKIHLIAHSRGTDVLCTALRELHLEISGGTSGDLPNGHNKTRDELKLGTVVLAAPDIDLDVVIQRMVTVRLGRIPERTALYICSKDEALGLSSWLFGTTRLGRINAGMFTEEELAALRESRSAEVIDAKISNPGAFGHDYFHSSPAVSSDLILLMRYQRRPGAEYGRPLGRSGKGFWEIDDHYPGKPPEAPQAASQ
ncbi:MAG TPA: alpha/beta hydrolase [Tepidisphaeraceae bacterium]